MSSASEIGLPEALEQAASALPGEADAIRPANGDPIQLASLLDADSAVRVLAWLLENVPAAGGELAEAWVDAGGQAQEAVVRVEPAGLPKAARKALKRAHHRLRSRGEQVPAAVRSEVVAKLPPIEETLDEALLSPVDPRGTRIAYLVESHPAGGARLFVIVMDEMRGIVDLDVFNAGRSKVKQFIRDATRRSDYPAVNAPADAVRALIARVAGFQRSDRPAPRAFEEWRSHLTAASEDVKAPGELARDALGGAAAEDVEALARAESLVRDRKLGPWPADADVMKEVAESIQESGKGVVIVSGAARQEQVDAAFEEAVERVFDAAFRERTAERFEESAFVRWKLGDVPEAHACLVAATTVREQEPLAHPLAKALLEGVLGPILKAAAEAPPESDEAAEREPEDSGLVVRP